LAIDIERVFSVLFQVIRIDDDYIHSRTGLLVQESTIYRPGNFTLILDIPYHH
jgi:hypothetical protein